jgi:hypothetical protein
MFAFGFLTIGCQIKQVKVLRHEKEKGIFGSLPAASPIPVLCYLWLPGKGTVSREGRATAHLWYDLHLKNVSKMIQ